MIFPLIATVLLSIGIVLLLKLTPEQVTQDLMLLLEPRDTLRERSIAARGNKRRHRLYRALQKLHNTLILTGKGKQFSFVCVGSLLGIALGAILAVVLDNLFLLPVLAVAFALAPFLYIGTMLESYEKRTQAELEVSLSSITSAYLRTEDIISAVEENIPHIKPPLSAVFRSFLGDAAIHSDIRQAIYNLKEKIDDEVFQEWCDILVRCQDDRSLMDTLQPTIHKLADVRMVNSDLQSVLVGAKVEYWSMVALLIGNVPLLYLLNKDWYRTLLYSLPGKITVGVCGVVILVTAILARKYTRPIRFEKKEE